MVKITITPDKYQIGKIKSIIAKKIQTKIKKLIESDKLQRGFADLLINQYPKDSLFITQRDAKDFLEENKFNALERLEEEGYGSMDEDEVSFEITD